MGGSALPPPGKEFHMRKLLMSAFTGVLVVAWVGVALAGTAGPRIDAAGGSFTTTYKADPVQRFCPGGLFVTRVSKLAGTANDGLVAGAFSLNGPISVTATATLSTTTGLGWAKATFVLRPDTVKKDRIVGVITGIIQGTGGSNAIGRGLATGDYQVFHPNLGKHGRWVATGHQLIANLEFTQSEAGFAGAFGGAPTAIPNLAAKTTAVSC
jgi:hypothetical protein